MPRLDRHLPRALLALLIVTTLASVASAASSADELLSRGQQMMGRGEYREALAILQPLTADTTLTTIQRARLYQQLAAARSQTGPDEAALADADRAERDARAVDAFDLLARIESVRGIVWLNRGRPLTSLEHLKACLAWALKSRQPPLIAGSYIRIAAAYQDLGDWTRALDAVNRTSEADPHPQDAARVQYLARRGLIEIELREGDAANASIREALDLTRRIGDRRAEAQVLIDLALVRERVDSDPRQAATYAAQAVAIARELRMTSLEIPALNQLGALLREAGQFNEAQTALRQALAVIARANEHRDEPYVLKNLGQVLIRLGHIDEGERTLRRAAARADEVNLTRVRWLARLELAQLHVAHHADEAGREFDELLAILEEQQSNVLLEGFRAGALDQTLAENDPYDRYVSFLLDRGEAAQAFHAAERERARVFLDTLSGVREQLAAAVPGAFRDAEDAALRHISASQAELRTTTLTGDRRRDLEASVARDEVQLTALRLRLAAERPTLANARYPKLLHVGEIQTTLLVPDEALLSFFLGANRSVAWLVTRDRLTAIPLPPRDEIEQRVRGALLELRNPASRDDRALVALSRTLALDRLAVVPDGTHLVVVPHGILYDVPFEALRGGDGRALVERFAVSYAPSAASLAFFRSLPPLAPRSTTLLALGNPNVHAGPPARTRQVDLERIDLLTPLPYTAQEMNGIADLFRPRVRVLAAGDATERALRESPLDQVRILHFATHGLIDETHPERSGLVLTASPPDDDGLLQMREIYSLGLQADLVTLSACQTALGRHATGEGIIGLTRAFFYAGARAVVASLWDIEDASTARLMQQFYANVRNGEAIDDALRHAKLGFLKAGGPTSRPFYWASFVAIGQARRVVAVPSERRSPLVLSVLAWTAVVAAIAIIARSRWRTSGAGTSAAAGRTRRER